MLSPVVIRVPLNAMQGPPAGSAQGAAMPRAEFEEKEYELLASIELADGGPGLGGALLFPAGQVLEHTLGYDAAADPVDSNPVWSAMQVPRPRGLQLAPGYWPRTRRPHPEHLPSGFVSLILQYKRPDFLSGGRAAQWRLWRCPYFRFTRATVQHIILRRIERRLGPEVVVRYAAPAFWRRAELEAAHIGRHVLGSSGYVSPSALGKHKVWTYIAPGVDGRANPSGTRVEFEALETLLQRATRLTPDVTSETSIVPSERPFAAHVRRLAEAVEARDPQRRARITGWERAVRRALPEMPEADVTLLRNYAAVASAMTELTATWHVALA
jgi:hypothetical protein